MRPDLFNFAMSRVRQGKLQLELSEALANCVIESRETGKPASLTLNLTVEHKSGSNMIFLKDQVKTKLPPHPTPTSVLFSDINGDLFISDPDQKEFAFRSAEDDKEASNG